MDAMEFTDKIITIYLRKRYSMPLSYRLVQYLFSYDLIVFLFIIVINFMGKQNTVSIWLCISLVDKD